MPVNEKQLTPEERAAARAEHGKKESSILDEIKDGLPADQELMEEDGQQLGRKGKKQVQEESEEEEEQEQDEDAEEGEEESSEESSEGEEEGEGESEDDESEDDAQDDGEGDEEEDEELSPESKKKAQKRINELVRQNRRMASQLKQARESAPSSTPSDPDMQKLEAMSAPELEKVVEALEDQRDEAILAKDKDRSKALRELSRKAQEALRTAPQRFQANQVSRFNSAVTETAEDYEVSSGKKMDQQTFGKIFERAKKIFMGSKNLQSSIDGQAEAWALAVEQHNEVSKFSAGNDRLLEEKRKVNKLKKKVSLGTSTQKNVNTKTQEDAKLYNKAKNGTNRDKAAFIRKTFNTDSLIPEQFRRQG